jgi:hypothetical protein
MAIQRRTPGAVGRRMATYAVGADIVIAALVGLITVGTFGWIVFFVGLVIIGVTYYNFRQVLKTKGMR